MKQQPKLVFLRDIWEALGRPKTFKAELGLPGTPLTGRVFSILYDETSVTSFRFVKSELSRMDVFAINVMFANETRGVPRWVPPYQQWKSQPTSTATSWHDIVRDVQSGLVDDKGEKQKERA